MEGTENMKDGERLASISLLRITATLAVVLAHSCGALLDNLDLFSMTGYQKNFFQICRVLSNWAVPCFFMITGCLLLDEKRIFTVKDCIFRYVNRMLLALCIFGFPMAMLMLLFETKSVSFPMLGEAAYMTLSGNTFAHLWYLYAMVGIYLIFPMLKQFTDSCSKELLDYLLVVLFLMDFCIPFLNHVFQLELNFSVPLGGYVFYVLCGKRIRDFFAVDRKEIRFHLLTAALGFITVFLVVITVLCREGQDKLFLYLTNYKSPITAVYSILIFVLFYRIKSKCNGDVLWKLDRLCFGVYLIHPIFIQAVYRFFRITPLQAGCYPVALFGFTAGFVVVSFLGSWILSFVKPLKKYIL